MRPLSLIVAFVCTLAALRGQDTNSAPPAELAWAQSALDTATQEFEAAGSASETAVSQDSILRLRRTLIRHLQRQVDEWKRLPDLVEKADGAERDAAAWTGFKETPPYELRFLDGLRDSVRAAELQMAARRSAQELLKQARDAQAATLAAADQRVRATAETLERSRRDPEASVRAQAELDEARLQLRIEQAASGSFEVQKRVLEQLIREANANLQLARRQVTEAQAKVVFAQKEFDTILAEFDRRRTNLLALAKTAGDEEEKAQQALDAARVVLKKAESLPEGSDRTARIEQARQQIDARGNRVETAALLSQFRRGLVELVGMEGDLWRERFEVGTRAPVDRLAQAARLASSLQLRLTQRKRFVTALSQANQAALAEEQRRAGNLSGAEQQASRQKLAELETRERILADALRAAEEFDRLLANFLADLQDQRESVGMRDRARGWGSSVRNAAMSAWNFELFSVEDSINVDGRTITGRRGITVGKVAAALLFLAVGLAIVGLLGRRLEHVLVSRFHRSPASALAIRNWSVFGLSLLAALLALMWARIPVTVFAFMGGALALGFGFGAQNLMSNLISGLILLFDKPIRPGDLLETQGTRGVVTQIGLRYSVLKRADGVELLVPNKDFLEQTVTNFTLNDPTLRQTIVVGVNYGSPTRAVRETLLKTIEEHGLVLKHPAPLVLLDDFGADALVFGVYYWIDVSGKTPGPVIASDLRFMFEQALAERGISLAFPQRDVHIRTPEPLRVAMEPGAPPA